MRTSTSKAWPKAREEGIVEPKATEVIIDPIVEPVKTAAPSDVLFVLHVKWEHIFIALLCLVIFYQWVQLHYISN